MEQLTKEELKVVEKWLNNELETINKVIEDRKERLLLVMIEDNKDELEWQRKDYKEVMGVKNHIQLLLNRIKYEQTPEERVCVCSDSVRGA